MVTRLIEIDLNIFLGLGISFAIGIIFGFYRSLKYSLANKLSLQEMARIYEKVNTKLLEVKRDRKFMLITGNIVMAVIAVILIVLTFTNFNS